MARHLITSAIPYINGIKHLGNLVGSAAACRSVCPVSSADAGNEVMFLCATDEHGTPAELAAAKAGQAGRGILRRNARQVQNGDRPRALPAERSTTSAVPPARRTTR